MKEIQHDDVYPYTRDELALRMDHYIFNEQDIPLHNAESDESESDNESALNDLINNM